MAGLRRFGVSADKDLVERFDRHIKKKGYANRCEALRDLMRAALVEEAWESNAQAVGTVTLVYNHHDPGLEAQLTDIQHRAHGNVVANMHSHLDHDNCLEVVMLRGKAKVIKRLADRLISAKGVKHGRLVMSAGGKALP